MWNLREFELSCIKKVRVPRPEYVMIIHINCIKIITELRTNNNMNKSGRKLMFDNVV